MDSDSWRRAVTTVTTVMFGLALSASGAHAQNTQRPAAHGADTIPLPVVSITPDTTLRTTPYDTSALDTVAARRLAGCYTVRVGTWVDPHGMNQRIWTPTEIRLDTARAPHARPGAWLRVETPGSVNPRRFAQPVHWAPVKRDSVQATIAASQTDGVTVFARRHADGKFTAIARYFTDVIALDPFTRRWMWESYPTAPVQLVPHACSSAG